MTQLLAFHNDPKIKTKYVKRVKTHYELDEIIQGKYWENGKGCAVGCTIQDDDILKSNGSCHKRYEEALGIPQVLARLEDRIFEGLSNGEAKEFPLRFLEAVNVGADLSLVFHKFVLWSLSDPKDGIVKFAKRKQTIDAIKKVSSLLEKKINGEDVSLEAWREVREIALTARRDAAAAAAAAAAAYAYAYAYAYAAADAAAAAYAYAYAYAAADAAAAADAYADAAADAAAYKKARSARFTQMANKLIELLKEAK